MERLLIVAAVLVVTIPTVLLGASFELWFERALTLRPGDQVNLEVDLVARYLERLADPFNEEMTAAENEVIGPAAAPVARVRGLFAYQLFVRARDQERLTELVAAAAADSVPREITFPAADGLGPACRRLGGRPRQA